ncbi:EcoAI/FtnUII family type I restriction enzme subunit R [Herbiconiux sp. A18JL235]|uniref:EcoAI/FtnUII family type I restriction enzme subunit R n=1 Tax=Herbiconiux sp. A18JL235 TaxID=3152363 RepID=A0AB39BLX9_9MICO
MTRDEAATRLELIDVALAANGWSDSQIDREYRYRAGRVFFLGDEVHREVPQSADYVLRERANGVALAVLEAKDESHSPGAGLQQAHAYAEDLGAPLAIASNGHAYVVQSLQSGEIIQIDAPPGPTGLLDIIHGRFRAPAPNPLLAPTLSDRPLRYYQERAVHIAVDAIMAGRKRLLLNLATGTGKTVVSGNIVWKLWRTGVVRKVLFLVDRVSLLGQAYNSFSAFGDARGVVGEDKDLPLLRDVHFATYQGLYSERGGGRLFEQYPPDYFDCVVIDECHRSGYGDWKAILDHFGNAVHVGLTATPKRADTIDTYAYFGAELLDDGGHGQADYEYSLARGIEDGFLATYQVLQVSTNLDERGLHIAREVEFGAELFTPEDVEIRDVYTSEQFEREISVPDRTRVLCEHLANKIREWGTAEKTIVFCVSAAHADTVRTHMQNLLGVEEGLPRYAVRIVSEERDSATLLEEFRDPRGRQPVLATTVDLLSTGVDIPSLRNVVFMKPVSSPIVFKQILGRGTRLDPSTGKLFFRVVDYTNATRLLDAWDLPSAPDEEWVTGAQTVLVSVRNVDGEPILGARVAATLGRRHIARGITDQYGQCEISGLPVGSLTVRASASGRRPGRVRVNVPQDDEIEVVLEESGVGPGRMVISGVEVTLAAEITLNLTSDGRELSVEQYVDLAGERIRDAVQGSPATLRELWRDPSTRNRLRQSLREHSVDTELLGLVLERPDVDDADLLTYAGWREPLRTREERARRVELRSDSVLPGLSDPEQKVLRGLLDQYRVAGLNELDSAAVFRTPALRSIGGLDAIVSMLGGPTRAREILVLARNEIYRNGGVA